MSKYKALVLTGPKQLEVQERTFTTLKPYEVRVELGAGGICGTDIHYYTDFANAGYPLQNPVVLGHEASGTVVELGSDVKNLSIGDKIAINPVMNCGNCPACSRGEPNVCYNKRFPGSATTIPHIDGYFREFFEVEARCCIKLNDSTDLKLMALAEPASCALHGILRAGNVLGSKVLITGAGPIGTFAGAWAAYNGASSVVMTDLLDETLSIAKQMGVHTCLNVKKNSLEDFVKENGEFDVVVEASGSTIAYQDCLKNVRKKGTVVQLSVLAEAMPQLPMNLVMLKELDIRGSSQFAGEFEKVVELIQANEFNVKPMISKEFSFEEGAEAFAYAVDRTKSMKVQFVAK